MTALPVPSHSTTVQIVGSDLQGLIYIGDGNAYANVDGVLFSAPINANGTVPTSFDDWTEVENFEEKTDELAAAQKALGLT